MSLILVIITVSYLLLMGLLLVGWNKVTEQPLQKSLPNARFSVVIPYRNEGRNLPTLLNSLKNLNYPSSHFEILLVNDFSKDNSRNLCLEFKNLNPQISVSLIENLRYSNSPKKDAISLAVKSAIYENIITTDADCEVPKNWLLAFNQELTKSEASMVAGPVEITPFKNKTFAQTRGLKYFYAFQEMDFLSLQAAGAGGFGLGKAFMCNGANLCYRAQAFVQVNGFDGNNAISSGDDVFLLQKFVENKYKVRFLKSKDAVVQTVPQQDLSALIAQRIRWAAKTPAYKSLFAKLIGLSVLLMNFIIILGFAASFFNITSYLPVITAFLFKFFVDFLLLYKAATFFNRREILRNYFWSSLLYPLFSTSVAILSLFKKIEWKGRVS